MNLLGKVIFNKFMSFEYRSPIDGSLTPSLPFLDNFIIGGKFSFYDVLLRLLSDNYFSIRNPVCVRFIPLKNVRFLIFLLGIKFIVKCFQELLAGTLKYLFALL